MQIETKQCTGCQQVKPLNEFYNDGYKRRDGTRVATKAAKCKECTLKLQKTWNKDNKHIRILRHCRKNDKIFNRKCELTKEHVKALINQPCIYCGDTERIGVDRADSSKGYTIENSKPCCTRCNIIKRDMPIEAWLILADKIRETREKGLFGDWKPRGGYCK